MGVIRKSSNIGDPFLDSIEDVLENIENVENSQEPEIRRPRKVRHRSTKPLAVGDSPSTSSGKSGKKKKRVENSNFLLSLADPEETKELSIHDFIPSTISVFTQLFIHKDSIEIWHEFINCTQDNEEWFQNNVASKNLDASNISICDGHNEHSAFTAIECFHKIDGELRHMLKKRHVPLGTLMYLEQELVTFFVNRPQSIYHCHLPSSFERLMIHAVSQYLDLSSLSYDRSGTRWTRVRNKNNGFFLPPILLSTFLNKKTSNATR